MIHVHVVRRGRVRDATFSRQSLVQTVSVGWDVPGEIYKMLGFRKNIQKKESLYFVIVSVLIKESQILLFGTPCRA